MKTLLLTLLGSLLFAFNVSAASLIINDKEYLSLDLTNYKTVAEVEALIASDPLYAGFELATDVDMAEIFSLMPHRHGPINTLHALSAALTSDQVAIFDWLMTGYKYTQTHGSYVGTHGLTYYIDASQAGMISYIDSVTGEFESGSFNHYMEGGVPTAIRTYSSNNMLDNPNTSMGDRSEKRLASAYSLFVRPPFCSN